MSLFTKRLEKHVQNIVFMEGYSDWKQGDRCIVITKECIEWIKKELSKEYELVKKFGKYILNTNSIDTLIHNWAQGRIYQINKGISVSTKTYPVGKAIESLKKFNHQYIFHPKDCLKLVEFAKSLASKTANTFTFGMDTDSLQFLFDDNEKGGSRERGGGGTSTSLDQMKNKDLTTNAKTGLVNATVNAFYKLGTNFEKVIINSGYRTHGWQAEYLVNNPDKWDKYGKYTEPLLLFCRDIVYGTLTQEHIKNVREEIVEDNILLTRIKSLRNSDTIFSEGYIQRIQKGNKTILIDVLEGIFERNLYRPSEHPYGKAFDLHKNNSGIYIYNNHRGGKYEEGNFKHIEYS